MTITEPAAKANTHSGAAFDKNNELLVIGDSVIVLEIDSDDIERFVVRIITGLRDYQGGVLLEVGTTRKGLLTRTANPQHARKLFR